MPLVSGTFNAIDYETLPWNRLPDADHQVSGVPKSIWSKIPPTYQEAVPLSIAQSEVTLDPDLALRISGLERSLVRFDERQRSRGYNLPALLLSSESASSSQIENLTSSVRNVALAEVSDAAPRNARIIAGNVA